MQELTPNRRDSAKRTRPLYRHRPNNRGQHTIDSPYRTDDYKAWVTAPQNRMQFFWFYMDTQYDRTLSAKGFDCIIVSQSDYLLPAKPRQQAVKLQEELLATGDGHEQNGSPSRPYSPKSVLTRI
jgi:hypothetical protein